MISNALWSAACFAVAAVGFVFFVEFARHTITGRDHDDRLFGSGIALIAFGVTLAFSAWGLAILGL